MPVTADIESGYAVDERAGRISTLRRVADAEDVPLFVNARIDTYFTDGVSDSERLEQADRPDDAAQAYRRAIAATVNLAEQRHLRRRLRRLPGVQE